MVAELEYVRNILAFTIDGAGRRRAAPRRARGRRHPRHAARAPGAGRAARRARRRAVRVRVDQQPRRHRARPRRRRGRLRVAGLDRRRGARRTRDRRRAAPRQRRAHRRGRPRPTAPSPSTAIAGLGALVDGGDVGDTYNWCPPLTDTVVDAPIDGRPPACVEAGPVRGRLEITRTYELPTHVEARRAGRARRRVEVRTTLELHAGDDLVRVHVELDNHGLRDHRLRVHLPLPDRAASSVAECAFGTVERGLDRRGRPHRAGPRHLPVASLRDGRRAHRRPRGPARVRAGRPRRRRRPPPATLAITLLRCTGMLSQGPMATRAAARPARSPPWRAPQSQHRVEARFAVHLGGRDPYAVVDDAFLPLLRHPGRRGRRAGRRRRARRWRSPAPR